MSAIQKANPYSGHRVPVGRMGCHGLRPVYLETDNDDTPVVAQIITVT